jgi:hypothetical protein
MSNAGKKLVGKVHFSAENALKLVGYFPLQLTK